MCFKNKQLPSELLWPGARFLEVGSYSKFLMVASAMQSLLPFGTGPINVDLCCVIPAGWFMDRSMFNALLNLAICTELEPITLPIYSMYMSFPWR